MMDNKILMLSDGAKFVIKRLTDRGFEAYAVGGCVRDMLMGIPPHDFDVTTNAVPNEVIEAFGSERLIETGLKHGTVTVLYNSEPIEITTYRIEGKYFDNRHPSSVTFTPDLAEDLSRRDFTVNAMAFNPDSGLVDLYGGREDIKKKVVRCVGTPVDRFREDGLRILRALRFASVLGFDIDDATADAIHSEKHLLINISRERIFAEFTKLLCGRSAVDILSAFPDVLEVIFGRYSASDLALLDRLPPEREVRYAAFFSTFCTPEEANMALRGLKPDKKLIHSVVKLLEHLGSEKDAKHLLKDIGPEQAKRLILLEKARGNDVSRLESEVEAVIESGECYCISMLKITGRDLIDLGFAQDSGLGSTIDALLEEVMVLRTENTFEALKKRALEMKNNIRKET